METYFLDANMFQPNQFKFHTCSASPCHEEAFWEPQGISRLSEVPKVSKSRVLLTDFFDWERAKGDTLLPEFNLSLWSLEGYSLSEGVLALVATVMPSLAITNSIKLCIALKLRNMAQTYALTSFILASLVRLSCGDTPNPHSYWASLTPTLDILELIGRPPFDLEVFLSWISLASTSSCRGPLFSSVACKNNKKILSFEWIEHLPLLYPLMVYCTKWHSEPNYWFYCA